MDSGIDLKHPDLNVVGNVTFVGGNDGGDKYGHGTHVAGTITGLNNGVGVPGVAPGVDLYAIKVLGDNGSGSYSNIIAGLQYAVANDMDVTNNSYGSSGNPGQTVHDAFIADNAGILNIAAAGNNAGAVIYPAAWPEVLAVSATNGSDLPASFSSFGAEVELAAPGRDIYSTYKGGSYATLSGTSMASPHVAGVAALVIGKGDISGPDNVRAHLASTAVDLGTAGFDTKFGNGLVDAENAVMGVNDGDDASVNGGGGDPTPTPEPTPPPSGSTWGSAAIDWGEKLKGRGGSRMDLQQTITARDGGGNTVADTTVAVTLTFGGADGVLGGGDDVNYNGSATAGSTGKATFQFRSASQGVYMLTVSGGADHDGALDVENPSCYDTVAHNEFTCP